MSLGQKEGDQSSLMAWMRGQGFSTLWQVWGRWELSGSGSSVRKGMWCGETLVCLEGHKTQLLWERGL